MLPNQQTDEQIINEASDKTLDPNAPSDDLKKALIALRDKCRLEDETVRNGRLSEYRRLELLWNNFSNLFWDDVAHDYRIPSASELEEFGFDDDPRSINIYRPHGESIIAALSQVVPGIVYYPDDADDANDCETASTYDKASKLISRHNKAKLLFMKALYILFNQGTAFGYNYMMESPKYGTIRNTKIDFVETDVQSLQCPQCMAELETPEPQICPSCGNQVIPQLAITKDTIPQVVGYEDTPKGRSCLDVFGPLNVKVSYFARRQEDIGYLMLEFEQHYAMIKELVKNDKELYDKIRPDQGNVSQYARWARLDPEYLGSMPKDVGTVTCIWFRPWIFQWLDDPKLIEEAQIKYPKGCYFLSWNDTFIEAYDENLDDHWSITYAPMSPYIHATPLGENLATVQDIRDDILDLELQTIERGIAENFADPNVLDFDKYSQQQALPGQTTPARPQPGKSLAESFYQTNPATLKPEVVQFRKDLDQDGQFVVGDFPSVYGGPSQGGSKTAAEYSQSRATALQRLGNTYVITSFWWCDLLSKATTEFLEYLKERDQDEKFVERDGNNFFNTWIKVTQLEGRVGNVEPENTDSLPETWAQIKDTLVNLMQLKDEHVSSAMFHPKNLEMLKKAIGVRDLYIPGEDDRNKQLTEFMELSKSEPINGLPSVMIDPEIDNDIIHIEVLTAQLVSPEGMLMKMERPASYENNLLHLQLHQQNLARKQAAMAPPVQGSGNPAESNQ